MQVCVYCAFDCVFILLTASVKSFCLKVYVILSALEDCMYVSVCPHSDCQIESAATVTF